MENSFFESGSGFDGLSFVAFLSADAFSSGRGDADWAQQFAVTPSIAVSRQQLNTRLILHLDIPNSL